MSISTYGYEIRIDRWENTVTWLVTDSTGYICGNRADNPLPGIWHVEDIPVPQAKALLAHFEHEASRLTQQSW